jgi:GDSL-like Lipase/Acylhydrolase family
MLFGLQRCFRLGRGLRVAADGEGYVVVAEFIDYVGLQLRLRGVGYVGIIGDSITESAPFAPVGGQLPVNAGIGGARVGDAIRVILPTLADSSPTALLIAIGVNDTKRQFLHPHAQRLTDFARDYRDLVRSAHRLTPRVGLLLIGPVAKGMDLGDRFFDPSLIVAFNGIIRSVGKELNAPAFPLTSLEGLDGFADPDVTHDGVHLSEAGYGEPRILLDGSCDAAR